MSPRVDPFDRRCTRDETVLIPAEPTDGSLRDGRPGSSSTVREVRIAQRQGPG